MNTCALRMTDKQYYFSFSQSFYFFSFGFFAFQKSVFLKGAGKTAIM